MVKYVWWIKRVQWHIENWESISSSFVKWFDGNLIPTLFTALALDLKCTNGNKNSHKCLKKIFTRSIVGKYILWIVFWN